MKRLAVVLAILVVWPVASHQTQAARKRLTVDLVTHEGALVARSISRVAWRPPGNQVAYIRPRTGPDAESDKKAESTLFLYDVDTRKERALLRSAAENEKLSLSSYQWSPKGDALLLEGQGDLWLLDVESGQKKRLTHDAQAKEFPTFSPTGERVAFVKKNDIYTLDLKSGAVERVTTDGADHILNGKLDWVYEEELADRSTGRSFEWSPDGQKIAYLRLDDNPVPEYPLTEYLSVHVGLFRRARQCRRTCPPRDSRALPVHRNPGRTGGPASATATGSAAHAESRRGVHVDLDQPRADRPHLEPRAERAHGPSLGPGL